MPTAASRLSRLPWCLWADRRTLSPGQAVLECESPEKADIVLGKLLADLFWDAGSDRTTQTLEIGEHQVTVHGWSPYGLLAIGRSGASVIAIGAQSVEALRENVVRNGRLLESGVAFVPAKPYPRYLDFFDLRSFRAYTTAMSSKQGLGLDSHWPFVKQFGMGGLAAQLPARFPALITNRMGEYYLVCFDHVETKCCATQAEAIHLWNRGEYEGDDPPRYPG